EPREALERGDELGPTVWVPAVVDRVHADQDPVRTEHPAPRERKAREIRLPRGDVGHGYPVAAALGNRDPRVGERGAAERADVDFELTMPGAAERAGDVPRCAELRAMALPVVERKRSAFVAARTRDRERRRGIETSRQ